MRENSPNEYTNTVPDGSPTATKSLFWKILPISPCGSGFCNRSMLSPPHKSLRMMILETAAQKKIEGDFPAIAPDGRCTSSTPIFDYGVQWKISAGRMLKSWKLSLTELKLDSR